MFHVGQKVVCVDDRPVVLDFEFPFKKNDILTISNITHNGCLGFHEKRGSLEGYLPERFRPLIERKTETGMAILRKVADDAAKRKNLIGVA